jgi:hypothetical protein
VSGDVFDCGGRVLSVFGPFASRALVELPVALAEELFDGPPAANGRTSVVDAIERDLAEMPERVRGSALAATAVQLAYELQDPYNSATSKSMCAKSLMEALAALRALAPPKRKADDVDEIADRRAQRRAAAGIAAPADLPRS